VDHARRLRDGARERCGHLLLDSELEHPSRASFDPLHEHVAWHVEPEHERRSAVARAPEPVVFRRERRAALDELECADDAPAVVGVNTLGGGRIALRERRVRGLGPEALVEPLESFAQPGGWRRRQLEARECRPQIEAGAADDDGRATVSECVVDCSVRELLVLRRVGCSDWFVRTGRPR
jgi:hypothetical protein